MSVIPATWEVQIGKTMVQSQSRHKISKKAGCGMCKDDHGLRLAQGKM
jgi:hypothetical protein